MKKTITLIFIVFPLYAMREDITQARKKQTEWIQEMPASPQSWEDYKTTDEKAKIVAELTKDFGTSIIDTVSAETISDAIFDGSNVTNKKKALEIGLAPTNYLDLNLPLEEIILFLDHGYPIVGYQNKEKKTV